MFELQDGPAGKLCDLSNASRAQLAGYWRLSEMTIARWIQMGAPVTDQVAMIEWANQRSIRSRGFREKTDEITRTLPVEIDHDWITWQLIRLPEAEFIAWAKQEKLSELQLKRALKAATAYLEREQKIPRRPGPTFGAK